MMCAMNSTFNVSIADTPFFALYHYDRRDLFDANRSRVETPCYNMDDYMALMENRAQQVFDHVRSELEKQSEQYLDRQRKRSKNRSLNIGQRVFCKYIPKIGESRKLAPKFEGPCVVIARIKATTYKVRILATQKELTHHIDNIISRDIIEDCEEITSKNVAEPAVTSQKVSHTRCQLGVENK